MPVVDDYAGPTPTILVGSLISSLGYLLVFLVTTGLIEPNVPLMAVSNFFAGYSTKQESGKKYIET